MRSHLAALVPKQFDSTDRPTTLRQLLQQSKRIVISNSFAERYFRTSKNPRVYHLLPSSVSVSVYRFQTLDETQTSKIKSENNLFISICRQNFQSALHQLNTSSDYALISDSVRLKLIASSECYLEVIDVNSTASTKQEIGDDFSVEYAIGVQFNSPFYRILDKGLQTLEQSGRLAALVDQHWTNYCDDERSEDTDNKQLLLEETNHSTHWHTASTNHHLLYGTTLLLYLCWFIVTHVNL